MNWSKQNLCTGLCVRCPLVLNRRTQWTFLILPKLLNNVWDGIAWENFNPRHSHLMGVTSGPLCRWITSVRQKLWNCQEPQPNLLLTWQGKCSNHWPSTKKLVKILSRLKIQFLKRRKRFFFLSLKRTYLKKEKHPVYI